MKWTSFGRHFQKHVHEWNHTSGQLSCVTLLDHQNKRKRHGNFHTISTMSWNRNRLQALVCCPWFKPVSPLWHLKYSKPFNVVLNKGRPWSPVTCTPYADEYYKSVEYMLKSFTIGALFEYFWITFAKCVWFPIYILHLVGDTYLHYFVLYTKLFIFSI